MQDGQETYNYMRLSHVSVIQLAHNSACRDRELPSYCQKNQRRMATQWGSVGILPCWLHCAVMVWQGEVSNATEKTPAAIF